MKKPKSIVISIPKPCSEDWNKMTPLEKGRYCSNCEKVVIDLTQYTDKQLLDFISNSKGRTCGKLSSLQLNREIISYESGSSSFLQRLFVGTALATTLSACNESDHNLSAQQTEQLQTFGKGNNTVSDSNPVIGKVKKNPGQSKEDTLVKRKTIAHKKTNVDTEINLVGMMVPMMPHFPDSNILYANPTTLPKYKNLDDYLSKNISYPKELIDKGIGGTVYVSFTIEKSGEVDSVKILRGAYPMLDSEAVRVVRSMPKWSPGEQNGHPVRTQYMLPIHFKIEDNIKTNK